MISRQPSPRCRRLLWKRAAKAVTWGTVLLFSAAMVMLIRVVTSFAPASKLAVSLFQRPYRAVRHMQLLRRRRRQLLGNLEGCRSRHRHLLVAPLPSSSTESEEIAKEDVSNGDEEEEKGEEQHQSAFAGLKSSFAKFTPSIQFPPRFVPGVAFNHHHHHSSASVERGDGQQEGEIRVENEPRPNWRTQAFQNHNNAVSDLFARIIQPRGAKEYDLVSSSPEWQKLVKHAEYIESTHLRELLQDADRCAEMFAATEDGVYLDYSRQRVTLETMDLLLDLAQRQDLLGKIFDMMNGEKINFTEDRAVLHTALRATRDEIGTVFTDGMDVVAEVHDVLDQVRYFTNAVRSGDIRGYTGKRLRNIVSVGIGGSYLGPEFLHECLKTEPQGIHAALGYSLRFLSNVDPVDVERTCADLDPEETLIVIVSKTFTTAETMLNARTMRQWLWDFMGNDVDVVRKHVVACSSISAVDKVQEFGIDTDQYFFRFWDWVGGRYSVCSAAGAVPISLLYGYDLFHKVLEGAHSIDRHFASTPFRKNIPVIMGLLGVWNTSFLGYNTRTTLPYAEALLKLPAHIQQLDMESNGKYVSKSGKEVDYLVGEIDFGEPGTNGQHSFFQLLHMGQTVPCDFIGFVQSQHDLCLDGESLSSHDELMANFFAQPDALANGKTANEVRAEGVAQDLVPHRTFRGNRPSLSLLLPKLTAYATGQLLAIYEHRTAVQGFLWDINSFDQWGVELGKQLAKDVKTHLLQARQQTFSQVEAGNPATSRILQYYIDNSRDGCSQDGKNDNAVNSFPTTMTTRATPGGVIPPERHDLGGKNGRLCT